MTKILMVCLGNICRSPLAHGVLESKLDSSFFLVDSAGTDSYHIGEQPDARSIEVAKINRIDITKQRARQFRVSDFDAFDLIYAMDETNYSNIISLARTKEDEAKVCMFLDENPNVETKNVPDPYYGGVSGFEHVFNLVEETCSIIAKRLEK